MYKKIRNIFGFLVLAAFVVGCANQSPTTTKTNQGRYKVTKDYGPDSVVDVSHVQDAIPKVEPLSRGGNRNNYEVLGKSYQVMASAKGYQESGGASWYGKKFHGYLTANGEKYDMYGMTAAHKSLPIPTYVQVTNLANNNKVVVRVNDRGPFHKGRIIDLSYAAAAKLGMLSNGTGQVLVESIDPTTWGGNKTAGNDLVIKKPVETQVGPKYLKASIKKPTVVDNLQVESMSLTPTKVTTAAITADVPEVKKAPVTSKKAPRSDKYLEIHYVQVGAYSTEKAAHAVTLKVNSYDYPILISDVVKGKKTLYKVIMGPMKSRSKTANIIAQLEGAGYEGAHLIDLTY